VVWVFLQFECKSENTLAEAEQYQKLVEGQACARGNASASVVSGALNFQQCREAGGKNEQGWW